MKAKVGVFSFTSCEGCQLTILNLEDEMLDLLSAIELVNFREAIDDRTARLRRRIHRGLDHDAGGGRGDQARSGNGRRSSSRSVPAHARAA